MYKGAVEKSYRGQQGCPAMGPMFCLMRKRMSEEAGAVLPGTNLFQPEYADDSFIGGSVVSVLARFKAELAVAEKYGVKYSFEKCKLHLLSGQNCSDALSEFRALGVTVCNEPNVEMLGSPLFGDTPFLESICAKKGAELEAVLDAVSALPKSHIAFHLLRCCSSFCKIVHLIRGVPKCYVANDSQKTSGSKLSYHLCQILC